MTNKPYKCMYCGTRYKNLSHVSICPCEHGSIVHSFSPVSNVPNTGAGETPNDTPKQNPLSNGVPVSNDYDDVYTCSECGCFTDYLVGAGSRCRQCVDEMGG